MRITLQTISTQVSRCTRCPLYKKSHKGVPGEGNPHARIFFVGQAPGKNEDATGRPFVGLAGKFLDKQLMRVGIDRADVFITSVVKHFPPDNRMPTPDEVSACLPYLLEQIEQVDPELVVLMGTLAQSIKNEPILAGRKILELPHPSAAMRFTKMRKRFETQLDTIKHSI